MKNRLGTHLMGPKWTLWKKKFLDISPKKFGSAYAQSPRKCTNFEILAKIEGKEANFFLKIYQGNIRIWFWSKKKSKLSHACVPLKTYFSPETTCCWHFYSDQSVRRGHFFLSFSYLNIYLPALQYYHSVGTSDFDAQMSGTKLLKGDGNLRLAYKKRITKYRAVACILDFLVHRKYTSILLWDENFFLCLDWMGYQNIRLFILISKITFDLNKKCIQKSCAYLPYLIFQIAKQFYGKNCFWVHFLRRSNLHL